jgi:mono/diheme cytochrome c family protein
MKTLTILSFWSICAATSASAQVGVADPARGHELSQRVCSGCHIISPGSATTANADIPPFATIARRSDMTAERLAGRIIIPHPAMPIMQLTVAEMRDIIAYIMSLKNPQ